MKPLALLLVILFSSMRIISQSNPDDSFWSRDFGSPTNDIIKAFIAEDNDLYWSEFGMFNYYNLNDYTFECLGKTAKGLILTAKKYKNTIYVLFHGSFEPIR